MTKETKLRKLKEELAPNKWDIVTLTSTLFGVLFLYNKYGLNNPLNLSNEALGTLIGATSLLIFITSEVANIKREKN